MLMFYKTTLCRSHTETIAEEAEAGLVPCMRASQGSGDMQGSTGMLE